MLPAVTVAVSKLKHCHVLLQRWVSTPVTATLPAMPFAMPSGSVTQHVVHCAKALSKRLLVGQQS
jgi:hypothetical protein